MPTWLIVTLGISLAVVLGVAVGILRARLDRKVDDIQRKINALQDRVRMTGASWLSDLLTDMVVGDERAMYQKARELVEADDSSQFFLEKVAVPMGVFAIRATKEDYPELYAKLEKAFGEPALTS